MFSPFSNPSTQTVFPLKSPPTEITVSHQMNTVLTLPEILCKIAKTWTRASTKSTCRPTRNFALMRMSWKNLKAELATPLFWPTRSSVIILSTAKRLVKKFSRSVSHRCSCRKQCSTIYCRTRHLAETFVMLLWRSADS